MKKILSLSLVFLFIFNISFAYNPTTKDEKALNNVYTKIEQFYQKNPLIVEKLYKQIQTIKNKYISNEKAYYLLSKLEEYINKKITSNLTYTVLEVIDGDTIKISYNGEERSIRLIGVDTPESYTTRFGYIECYGNEAKNYLKNLIENKEVKLEFDETQAKEDKYSRLLGYVIYNNENLNNKLIQEGYGFEYTYDKKYNYQDNFLNSQKQAKELKKGLWAENTCNGERKAVENSTIDTSSGINTTTNSSYYNPNNTSYLNMGFDCKKQKYCKYMSSCEEATYYYKVCGAKSFDKDLDSIPCEDICGTQIK